MVESDDKSKANVEMIFEDRKSLLAVMAEANRLVSTGAQRDVKVFECAVLHSRQSHGLGSIATSRHFPREIASPPSFEAPKPVHKCGILF